MVMRKLTALIILTAAVLSCKKDPAVEVTASFTTNKDVFQVGEEIIIENTSVVKNNILAFCQWEYGDMAGTEKAYGLELEGVSFSLPGLYTITLTAYAEQGAGQDTYSRQVLVIDENDIPWADFDCPAQARVGEEVVFEDRSVDNIGGIKSWRWNIGGIESVIDSPAIVFDAPATGVLVTLTVTDAFDASDTVTKTIDIIE